MSTSTVAVVDYGMGNLRSVSQAVRTVARASEQHWQILVTDQPEAVLAAQRVILPGQGAMPECMRALQQSGLLQAVLHAAAHKPLLGICVGMQMLLERSAEGHMPCLGLMAGDVRQFQFADRPRETLIHSSSQAGFAVLDAVQGANHSNSGAIARICNAAMRQNPQMPAARGMDQRFPSHKVPHMGWNRVRQTPHPLWHGIDDDSWYYFVHSFYACPQEAQHVVGQSHYGQPFASAIARDNIFATQFHPEKSADAGLALLRNFLHWNP